MAVDGGGPVVLSAMEPMFFAQRMFRLMVGIAATGSTGVLWFVGCLLLPALSGDEDSAGAIIAIGAAILACMWASWATARKLIASVNIEHLGES